MPYRAGAVANELIDLARRHDQRLDPMKLQKLVYFANGWHAAIEGEPLIDEQVEAWPYGPVIPSLYHAFKRYGNQPIGNPLIEFGYGEDPESGETCQIPEEPRIDDASADGRFVRDLLARIWDVYGGYTGVQLSNLTHEPGTPWHSFHERAGARLLKGTDIPFEMIRDHFLGLAMPAAASRG